MTGKTSNGMRTLRRALDVIRFLADNPSGRTLTEISESTSIPISTLHRIVTVLVEEEFAMKDGGKSYALASDAVNLQLNSLTRTNYLENQMHNLAKITGETVFISRLVGNDAVCVSLIRTKRPSTLSVHVGDRLPLHASAAARSILSLLPETKVREILKARELTKFTNKTLTSTDQVMKRIYSINERGYDVCWNELDEGVLVVSIPFSHNSTPDTLLSISIAGVAIPDENAEETIHVWKSLLEKVAGSFTH